MFVSSVERTQVVEDLSSLKSRRTVEPALKSILLCKKAYTDGAGHNVYEGEFKTISVSGTPAVEREIFVVTKWGDGAGLDFRQEIRIFDPAGNLQVFNSREFEKEFHLGSIYHEHMVFGCVSGLLLPREGRYRIEIYLNGEPKGKTYFNVVPSRRQETAFEDEEVSRSGTAESSNTPGFISPLLPLFRTSLNCFRPARD